MCPHLQCFFHCFPKPIHVFISYVYGRSRLQCLCFCMVVIHLLLCSFIGYMYLQKIVTSNLYYFLPDKYQYRHQYCSCVSALLLFGFDFLMTGVSGVCVDDRLYWLIWRGSVPRTYRREHRTDRRSARCLISYRSVHKTDRKSARCLTSYRSVHKTDRRSTRCLTSYRSVHKPAVRVVAFDVVLLNLV